MKQVQSKVFPQRQIHSWTYTDNWTPETWRWMGRDTIKGKGVCAHSHVHTHIICQLTQRCLRGRLMFFRAPLSCQQHSTHTWTLTPDDLCWVYLLHANAPLNTRTCTHTHPQTVLISVWLILTNIQQAEMRLEQYSKERKWLACCSCVCGRKL